MWEAIEQAISAASGEQFTVVDTRAAGGGCINEALLLRGARRSYFLKLNRAELLDMFEAEAAGLAAINATDTLRAPQPVAWGVDGSRSWLALEYIEFCSPQAQTSARLGEKLAAMHRCPGPAHGWERDNTIGATPQPNPWTADWVEFLREHRLGFQLSLAARNGAPQSLLQRGDALLAQLPAFFADYRPQPSLLHGDLWGGNWAADQLGQPVIYDPATCYGDREADIAMTELFGGFDREFYRAYQQTWPLDPGYQQRKLLYQLYHVLNHFNLFGGGYARQAEEMIARLLSEI